MGKVQPHTKRVISAKIEAFPTSGMRERLSGGITRYHKSCVGRDFKALAQMAPFVLWDHMDEADREVWLNLSQVNKSYNT